MPRFEIIVSRKASSGQQPDGARLGPLGRLGSMIAAIVVAVVAIGLAVAALVLGYLIAGVALAVLFLAILLAMIRSAFRSLRN